MIRGVPDAGATGGPQTSRITLPALHYTVALDGAATGGAYAVLDIRGDRRAGTPVHLHRNEDQVVIVLEGAVTVWHDGVTERLRPGDTLALPRDRPHRVEVEEGPARLLCLCLPAGYEAVIDAATSSDHDDRAALLAAVGVATGRP